MRRQTIPTPPRSGFTLIELLVVISIIIILMALLAAAVFPALGAGSRARTVNEINQLSMAVTAFKNDFKINPPSHVTDPMTGNVRRFQFPDDINDPEMRTLKVLFPRWNPPLVGGTGPAIDMTKMPASYQALVSKGPLNSNQCMVVFLGGPGALLGPASGYDLGWDVSGPYAPSTGSSTKKGPYFQEFPLKRMSDATGAYDGQYRDVWGTPFAYFASSGERYDANAMFPWDTTVEGTPGQVYTPPTTNPPTSPPCLAHPYRQGGRWVNPNGVQIISAGKNKVFGMGSPRLVNNPATNYGVPDWTPGTGDYAPTANGSDDIANFNNGMELKVQSN